MGLFDDLYGPYHQVVSKPILPPANPLPPVPATPTATTPTTAADPLQTLLVSLLAPKQQASQGLDFTKLLSALRNDPVGDANRTSSLPSYAPGSTSPFNTGYFQDAAGRTAVEAARGPVGSYAVAPTRTVRDYAEDTPKGTASFFGHPLFIPHVSAGGVAPNITPPIVPQPATRMSDFAFMKLLSPAGRQDYINYHRLRNAKLY